MTEDHAAHLADHFKRREMFAGELAAQADPAKGWQASAEQGAIDFAKEGLKAAYLINAGAIGIVVAAASPLGLDGPGATLHSIPFFVGLAAAAGYNFCAYFTQIAASYFFSSLYWLEYNNAYQAFFPDTSVEEVKAQIARHDSAKDGHLKSQGRWRNAAIGLAVLSLGSFAFGGAYLICDALN
jgi:hypothetical protein